MASGLPPNQRYITTHNADGKSVYADSPEQVMNSVGDTGLNCRSYAVANVPAILKDETDIKAYKSGPESVTSFQRSEVSIPTQGGKYNGANLVVVDLKPGGFSVMHQTVSIDFSICCIGTIYHDLDGGERVTLKPGDHIVQRGTAHRWVNASETEWARFVAVTLPIEPFEVAGKLLKEKWLRDSKDFRPSL